MDYDIVIVGAGPAGSTLARLLPKSLKIAIIDKKNHNGEDGFKKPCGGLLSPDAQKSISRLGLKMPLDILVSPQIFAVDTLDLTNNLQRYYQRFYLNMDRHKFDLWLISLIPKSVDIFDQSFCEKIEQNSEGYLVYYSKNGKTNKITTKYIVGADGANSIVRKTFVKIPIRQYLSIQKNYKTSEVKPYYVCFFDNNITDCYGWINMKDNIIQIGAALPIKTAKENFEKLRKYFVKKGYPFEDEIYTEACITNRPSNINQINLGHENAFLVGEAAGFISTSSLEGISFAMDSALELSTAFRSGKKDLMKVYKGKCRKLYFKMLTKILKSPFIYNKFLRKLVLKSGITSMNVYDEI